jgi:hypothetical protein
VYISAFLYRKLDIYIYIYIYIHIFIYTYTLFVHIYIICIYIHLFISGIKIRDFKTQESLYEDCIGRVSMDTNTENFKFGIQMDIKRFFKNSICSLHMIKNKGSSDINDTYSYSFYSIEYGIAFILLLNFFFVFSQKKKLFRREKM